MSGAQQPTAAQILRAKLIRPLKEGFKEVWSYTTGKVGFVMLAILIATSVAATITMPQNFVSLWESASFWDENPQLVPPQWVGLFGAPVAPQQVAALTAPTRKAEQGGFIVLNYSAVYVLSQPQFPQDIVAKAIGVAVFNVSTNGAYRLIAPSISLVLSRPDNLTLTLTTKSPAVANFTGSFTRTDVKLGTENYNDVALQLAGKYINTTKLAKVIGDNQTLQMIATTLVVNEISQYMRSFPQLYLFGSLDIDFRLRGAEINSTIKPYYDAIVNLSRTLSGSASPVLQYINATAEELELAMGAATLSSKLSHLYAAAGNLTSAYVMAYTLGLLTPDELARLSDAMSNVAKLTSELETTTKYYDIEVSTKPLTGKYRADLVVSYSSDAPLSLAGAPLLQARIIFKGSAFGLLGTDDLGRDLAVVLFYGFPVAMAIGLTAAVATTLIGLILGIVSGYYGGFVDEAIQRTVDIIGNIPLLPILILLGQVALMVFANQPFYVLMTIIAVLIAFGWGGLAITVRTMTLSIKEEPYIEAALALGASNTRVIWKHILPQVAAYGVASMVFSVPNAILTEAGLSVLGIRTGYPTWGSVLSRARDAGRYDVWWWIFPPGFLISITSLAFVLVGLAIEKIVEPRLRTI